MRTATRSEGLELVELTAPIAAAVREMTFPSYRHLLELGRRPRHPFLGGENPVEPFGFVAFRDREPVGLGLAEAPVERGRPAELLSVFVEPACRRRGVGGRLVGQVEHEARRRGFAALETAFTTGKPGTRWLAKILARRGWSSPERECLVVHLDPRAALASPAFSERSLRVAGAGIEVFPWSDLDEGEERELLESNRERRWIEPALEPWQFSKAGLDASSYGARHRGRVVGWVLNHRPSPGMVRISVAFLRADLAAKGRILPVLRASFEHVARVTPGDKCTFITTFCYPRMVAFIERRIRPLARFVGESRRARLALEGRGG